ncbi:hypothetical protein LCGC14_1671180, partial [marine sediment metagenome]
MAEQNLATDVVSVIDEALKTLDPETRQMAADYLKQFPQDQQLAAIDELVQMTWAQTPVPIRDFILGDDYLNLKGADGRPEIYGMLMDDLEELFSGSYIEAVLTGGIGWGKALAVDTRLPTPTGWITIGDVQVGDWLFDRTGEQCQVTRVTKVMHQHECYEVKFSDGSTIVADADHQWAVTTWNDRRNAARRGEEPEDRVVTTKQMIDSLKCRRMNNYAVRTAEAIGCDHKDLLIDPYVLGVWLGDGDTSAGRVTNADSEVWACVEDAGYELSKQVDTGSVADTCVVKGLQVQLRSVGTFGDKYIPDDYLRSSIEQRTALLQGLMDSDGSVQNGGYCEFLVINERLASGAFELVASLGYKPTWAEERATLNGYDCGPRYRVSFTTRDPVFRLSRKLKRQSIHRQTNDQILKRRYITAIVPVESVPVRCIEVDSPSHLFLCGEAFIPTHNSAFARLCHCYMLHQLGCLVNPAKAYGLQTGSRIVLINLAIHKKNAEQVVFQQVQTMVDNSKWFKRNMPRKRERLDHIEFHNGVWLAPFAANEKAVVGFDAFGGVMDEVNEMAYAFESTRKMRGEVVFDQAQRLRDALVRRMKSRFEQVGLTLPGILVQISSSKYPGEYTERRIKEAKDGDTSIFWRQYAMWQTNREKYSPTTFRLALGTKVSAPFVVQSEADNKKVEDCEAEVIEVPDDLENEFHKDIHSAIRDFIGRSTAAITPFIARVEKVFEAFQRGKHAGLEHPFKFEYSTLGEDDGLLWDIWSKKFDPTVEYFAHGDLAKHKLGQGDRAGIAIGHIAGKKLIVRTNQLGQEVQMIAPHYVIDFV